MHSDECCHILELISLELETFFCKASCSVVLLVSVLYRYQSVA